MNTRIVRTARLGILAVALLVGIVGAQGQLQSPGYSQASTAGSCHGVFGSYMGTVLGGLGSIRNVAPPGNTVGMGNSNPLYCSYTGQTLTSPWHPT